MAKMTLGTPTLSLIGGIGELILFLIMHGKHILVNAAFQLLPPIGELFGKFCQLFLAKGHKTSASNTAA